MLYQNIGDRYKDEDTGLPNAAAEVLFQCTQINQTILHIDGSWSNNPEGSFDESSGV